MSPRRHRIRGKLIPEIVEPELQARRQFQGVVCRPRHIAERVHHLPRRTKVALTVHRQQAARMIERGVMTNRGEEIKHLTFVGSGIANAVRCYDRQLERLR